MGAFRALLALLAIQELQADQRFTTHTITFDPGAAGLLVKDDGTVFEFTDEGQASRLLPTEGLSAGEALQVKEVNGEAFSSEILEQVQNATEQRYTITFERDRRDCHGCEEPNGCEDWEHGGCKTCYSWEDFGGLKAKCLDCKAGWAVIDGPPTDDSKFTSPDGSTFKWIGHCAEIDSSTTKKVIAIRHGLSTWNEVMESSGKLAGIFGTLMYKDAPLDHAGLRQAQRLAQVIKKANVEVYGAGADEFAEEAKAKETLVKSARKDLNNFNLEKAIPIFNKSTKAVLGDDILYSRLTDEKLRDELDVLVGRKCAETAYVASPLARAIDTLLIGTLERNVKCSQPLEISSALQELEHNLDCQPNTLAGQKPSMTKDQEQQYIQTTIGKTRDFVKSMYKGADVSRHTIVRSQFESTRLFDHVPTMKEELDNLLSSEKKYRVWAGHSIWFRHFFRSFSDQSEWICRRLGKIKMANTAMLSFRVRRLKSSPRKFVVDDCKFIYLHEESQIGFKKHEEKKEL